MVNGSHRFSGSGSGSSGSSPAASSDALAARSATSSYFECAICLEAILSPIELSARRCGHRFHPDCLMQWLQRSTVCPMCREPHQRRPLRPPRLARLRRVQSPPALRTPHWWLRNVAPRLYLCADSAGYRVTTGCYVPLCKIPRGEVAKVVVRGGAVRRIDLESGDAVIF